MPDQLDEVKEIAVAEGTISTPLVTVLYSLHRAVYTLPSLGLDMWLSTAVEPITISKPGASSVTTANECGYRHAYHKWPSIVAGDQVTLPADDPMVLDYQAYAASLQEQI